MFRRVALFLVTNLAALIALSISMRPLGIETIPTNSAGLDLRALLVFAAIVGFAGRFISLAMSKWSAKFPTGAQVIERPPNQTEARLVDRIPVYHNRRRASDGHSGGHGDHLGQRACAKFRADAGGARAGKTHKYDRSTAGPPGRHRSAAPADTLAAFGISGRMGQGLARLFLSHPPLEERIAALRAVPDRACSLLRPGGDSVYTGMLQKSMAQPLDDHDDSHQALRRTATG